MVTGMGIISALGIGVDKTFQSLVAGESGIGEIKYLSTTLSDFPSGEVPYSNYKLATILGVGFPASVLRTSLLGIAASGEAVASAGITESDYRKGAFINGTTVGGMDLTEQVFGKVYKDGSECEETELLKYNDCGYVTDIIAERLGDFKIITTTSTACSSAANAIILGAELIRSGRIDFAVAGGAESLSKFHLNGFNSLMILDRKRCRPFSDDRAGINLGEGAAYLVLEKRSEAERKGKRILAVLKGWGNACDAFHQTATSEAGLGPSLAMEAAINIGELSPEDIDYINAHGTGTPDNDRAELTAMKKIWPDKLPAFSSTKVLTGHSTSAAGAIESVISVLSLQNNFIPGQNMTGEFKDKKAVPVLGPGREAQLRSVLCNSFGFGGNDSSLLFSKDSEISEREEVR